MLKSDTWNHFNCVQKMIIELLMLNINNWNNSTILKQLINIK